MEVLTACLALGSAFCFALDQVFGKLALRSVDVWFFNAIRPSFALLLIVPFGYLVGELTCTPTHLIPLAIFVGIIGQFGASVVYFFVMKNGVAHRIISVGNTTPLWAVLASTLILGEKVKPSIYLATCLVIFGAHFLNSKRNSEESDYWQLEIPLALLVSIIWGSMIVPAKYSISHGMSRSFFLLIVMLAAAVAGNIAMLIQQAKRKIKYDRKGIWLSIFSGTSGLFLGQALMISALKIQKASKLAPIIGGSIIPFGFFLSILLLNEKPTKNAIFGTLIIFGSVLLITIKG